MRGSQNIVWPSINQRSVIPPPFVIPPNGSDTLSSNIRSDRSFGDRAFHSSRACTVRCQSARAAALPHS
eukprot:1256930-Lingulodinium_polyedra.AAC.1